ncbi:MAG: hypothetical protein ACHP7I_06615 [Terriglobales bacterium]
MRLFLAILWVCMFVACRSDQTVPSDKSGYVGTYVYKSVDKSVDRATDHELDRLVLQADGHYILVQGGSTKAKSETKGVWTLVPGDPPNVELDHHGYPIQVKRGEIRLLINDDLGEWYAKTE